MKKVFKILFVILIVILLLLGAFVIWQWDNFSAFTTSVKYAPEELETLVIENENRIDEVFSDLAEDGGVLSELTDEEQEKLLSGEMTEEEIERVKEVLEAPKNKNNDAAPSRVNEIISRIYVLRAEFVNRLDSLEGEALAEKKTVKKGGLSVSKILSFAEKYIDKAKSLEADCDSRMEAYLSELKAELERLGQSTSMISEIRSTYKKEKQLKKSQLFNKYSKYLK